MQGHKELGVIDMGLEKGYEIALNEALKDFKELSPYAAASKSGTDFTEGNFKVKFFNRTFLISHPYGGIKEVESETPVSQLLHVILIHYLIQADGTPVADRWIVYRNLPGANFFEKRFTNLALNPLIRAFGNDIEGFKCGGLALGGMPMTRTGDIAFRFLALPKIAIACILYLGDEEVRPSINILFDAASPSYLPTEDMSWLATYLNTMRKYKTTV